jgi:hypothetical protein
MVNPKSALVIPCSFEELKFVKCVKVLTSHTGL